MMNVWIGFSGVSVLVKGVTDDISPRVIKETYSIADASSVSYTVAA